MIETTNPEIDVNQLREQIRREAAKPPSRSRRPAPGAGTAAPGLPAIAALPHAPSVWIPGTVPRRKEKLDELILSAREKTEVSSIIPKFLRGLFRKQGAYNRGVLESIKVLAQGNEELTKRVREIGTCLGQLDGWLRALHQHRDADVQWMTAAASSFAVMAQYQEELRNVETDLLSQAEEQQARLAAVESSERALHEQVNNVHAEANTIATQARDLQQQLNSAGDHLRGLQTQLDGTGVRLDNLQAEWARRSGQAQIEKAALHLRDLQAQADRLGVHINNLQGFVDQHAAETRLISHNLEQRIGDQAGLHEKLGQLDERQTSEGIFIKGELSEQGSLLRRLLGPQAETGAKVKPLASKASETKNARALDSFYLSFENRFRGSRTEIKNRVKFYLPFIAKAKAGTAGRAILDLGCGRGEWLELLKENKLEGHGVDLNSAMIAQCKERDLAVTQGDALDYLRSLRPNTHGGVTGFHIIEHLPFETLMEFLRETRRVLKPGGIAIFESPNCKNLVVGAANFNIDPTHRNPVFPETAEFMLQSHGFERISLEYLSPVSGVKFDDSTKELRTLKDMLYGPQDFAVIAHKPAAR
jgi:SAM-dependent methyltransferase